MPLWCPSAFEPVGWLVNRTINNFALIVIMIWLQTGFCMVLLSSAVKGIPKDVIEAARIDGAGEWQDFSSDHGANNYAHGDGWSRPRWWCWC